MIRLNKINKSYFNSYETNHVLKDITLSFDETGLNFLVGKSGSGKTTLLNLIGCLDSIDSGELTIGQENIHNTSLKTKDHIRNNYVTYVYQDFNVIDHLTVFDNIALVQKLRGEKDDTKVEEAINKVLLKGLGNRKMKELSGGQKQRVGIARALVKDSPVLLCDEPTGNLDAKTSKEIFDLLAEISKEKLVIIVTHNEEIVNNYDARVLTMSDGSLIGDRYTRSAKTILEKEHILKEDFDLSHIESNYDSSDDVVNKFILKNSRNINDDIVFPDDIEKSNSTGKFTVRKFVFDYIVVKKIRFLMVVFVSTLLFASVITLSSVYFYDSVDDVIEFLDKTSVNTARYDCTRNGAHCYDREIVELLSNTSYGEKVVGVSDRYGIYNDISEINSYVFQYGSSELNNTEVFNLTQNSKEILDVNEIYITDVLANELYPDKSANEIISRTISGLTIQGIIITDYENIEYDPYGVLYDWYAPSHRFVYSNFDTISLDYTIEDVIRDMEDVEYISIVEGKERRTYLEEVFGNAWSDDYNLYIYADEAIEFQGVASLSYSTGFTVVFLLIAISISFVIVYIISFYINYIYKLKEKDTQILKSLGISNKKLVILYASIISTVVILSTLIAILISNTINSAFSSGIMHTPVFDSYELVRLSLRSLLVIVIVAIIIIAILSVGRYKKISNE